MTRGQTQRKPGLLELELPGPESRTSSRLQFFDMSLGVRRTLPGQPAQRAAGDGDADLLSESVRACQRMARQASCTQAGPPGYGSW